MKNEFNRKLASLFIVAVVLAGIINLLPTFREHGWLIPSFAVVLIVSVGAVVLDTNTRPTQIGYTLLVVAFFVLVLWVAHNTLKTEPVNVADLAGWQVNCANPTGKPQLERAADETDQHCFNTQFSQNADDFRIDWTVEVRGEGAIFVFGEPDEDYYSIHINLRDGVMFFFASTEPDSGKLIPTPYIDPKLGHFNRVAVVRSGTDLSIYVNDQVVGQTIDTLFEGQPKNIYVGFGATTNAEETGSIVTLESVRVTPSGR